MGKSKFSVLSARTGELLALSNKFECDVWSMAELDPTVKEYRMHAPSFKYFDGKREREGDFFLQVEKKSGETELWHPAEDWMDPDRPIEKARSGFSELLEMKYRRIFRSALYADAIAVKNRRTMVGLLSENLDIPTEEVEAAVMTKVLPGKSYSLNELTDALAAVELQLRLAVFKLCMKGRLTGESSQYIRSTWTVRRSA